IFRLPTCQQLSWPVKLSPRGTENCGKRAMQPDAIVGRHYPSRRRLTERRGPLLDRRALLLSRATAEEAAGIAKQICPDIWIGISAHNNSAGPTAGGPTDNIRFGRIARHDRYARCRVRVSLLDIRAWSVCFPGIGRGRDRNAERANKQS